MLNFNGKTLKVFIVSLWIGCLPNHLLANDSKEEPKIISSLQWGEVLFSYFRGDKMDALIRLYARGSRHQLQLDQPQADLLAAGILLDLGLASLAQKKLDNIDQNQLSTRLKSRLALVLARVYFQSQDFDLSQHWLKTVNEEFLSAPELSHKKMMQAQLHFSIGEYELAAEQLKKVEDKTNLQYYAFYNNGLSLLKSADDSVRAEGRLLLQKVSTIEPTDQEQYALIDQANLALGLDALNSGQSIQARQYFIAIRLDGLVSNDALLMMGWAFANTDNFEEALTYWNTLATKKDRLEPTIQEAWLAVPYAYQQLGNLTLAAQGYEKAIQSQIEAKARLELLLKEDSWRIILSESNTEYFSRGIRRQLIANPKFYHLFKQWQQLQLVQDKLRESLSLLPILSIVLNENEVKFQQKSALIQNQLLLINQQQYIDGYQILQQQFQLQTQKATAEATLAEEDYNYWTKLESLKSIINTIPEEINAEKKATFRLVSGVAKWKFHRQRDENLWSSEHNLDNLRHSIAQLSAQLQQLKLLINQPRPAITDNSEKVNKLILQGQWLEEQLNALIKDFENAMTEEFSVFVELRKNALKALGEQANTAIARLRFQALKKSADHE